MIYLGIGNRGVVGFLQALFLGFALSLPLAALVGAGRAALCAWRMACRSAWPFAVLSLLMLVLVLAVFAAGATLWFIAAVGHGPKDRPQDYAVLIGAGAGIYLAAVGAWRFSRYAEARRS